jgi:hypothetical protein
MDDPGCVRLRVSTLRGQRSQDVVKDGPCALFSGERFIGYSLEVIKRLVLLYTYGPFRLLVRLPGRLWVPATSAIERGYYLKNRGTCHSRGDYTGLTRNRITDSSPKRRNRLACVRNRL